MVNREIKIGDSIRRIREARGITQKELGDALGVSEPTVSKLESNQRQLKAREIPVIYEKLRCTASELFGGDQTALIGKSFFPRLTGEFGEAADEIRRIMERLGRQAANLIDLEKTLGIKVNADIPRSDLPVGRTRGEINQQATSLAMHLRDKWDLGIDPIHDLKSLLEQHGIIWTYWRLPENIGLSGLCAPIGERVIILINAGDITQRQRFSLGHELCHALVDARDEVVLTRLESNRDGRGQYSQIEKRADFFSGKFLMSLQSATLLAKQRGFDLHDPDDRGIIQLAYFFGLSSPAVLVTLRSYEVITFKKYNELKDTLPKSPKWEFSSADPVEEWAEKTATAINSIPRLVRLGFKAYFDGAVNETSLGELLDINRSKLTRLLSDYRKVTAESGG